MKSRSLSRRRAMQSIASAAALPFVPRLVQTESRRPNLIVILADDMGFSDLGVYGSEIATPNLDDLARRGVRFSNFYNCARCCPTRSSILTGLYPHQAGIGHMVDQREVPAYQGYLNQRGATIAEALRPAGYHTFMAGKWHVGEARPHWPIDRGFESYYGLISGGTNYFKIDENRIFAQNEERIRETPDGFYITDAFTDHALSQIQSVARDDRPFFLYLAYTSPHWPLHAHPADIEKYKDRYVIGWDELRQQRHQRQKEKGVVDPRWPLTPRDDSISPWNEAQHREWEARRMAVYAAQIHCMDRNIGRLLTFLHEQKLEENTLILFLADNGGCAENITGNDPSIMPGSIDTFQSYGLAWAQASNTPFRRYKHWVHEGGVSTPLIACWPGEVKEQESQQDQPGHVIDILPTCLAAAGASYPESLEGRPLQPPEGQSLLPTLHDAQHRQERTLYWEHEGNRAVHKGDWKLVSMHPGGWELYHIPSDRTEQINQAQSEPGKVKELAALYDEWAERCGVLPWDDVRQMPRK